jgi:4-diphosphocytidyl-2-C-methyl-D-erythritol kinase
VPLEGPANLAFRAAQELAAEAGRPELGALVRLEKRVPAGMGLGGGSSDAAAVLRGLNRLWGLDLDLAALTRVAARLGSDVAFFLHGGTALATGRGEVIEPLVDAQPFELTLFVSELDLTEKTRLMYSTLTPADFTEGQRTRVTAATVSRGLPLGETDLINAFDRHVAAVAPQVGGAMALCRDAEVGVMAAGSGCGFFSLTPPDELPGLLLRELAEDWGVTALACRAQTRAAALVLREV